MNSEPGSLRAPSAAVVAIIIAALTLVRIMIGLNFDLFPDEAVYVWLGYHVPVNFSPHPPGAPFIFRTGTFLFGMNEIGVRFFPFLLMSVSLIPIWLLGRRILGAPLARWAIIAVATVPIYMIFGALATPDSPQFFLWVLALYFVWRALESGHLGWWLVTGMVIGVGLYVKYHLILFYPSLVLCLALPSSFRRHLRSPGPYVAASVSFLIFVPFAAWQSHLDGWSALRYHLRDRQNLGWVSPTAEGVYQAVHLAYISPLLYIGAVAGMVWAGINGIRRRDSRLVFLFSFSAVVYFFFALIAAFTRRDLSREQWDAIAYVPALMGGLLMVNSLGHRFGSLPRFARIAPLIGALTIGMFLLESCIGVISRHVGRAPGTALMGWREMGRAVDSELPTLSTDKPAFVLCDSFIPAVQYAFYGKGTDRVYSLDAKDNVRYGMHDLFHKHGLSQDELAFEVGRNGIFVLEEHPNSRGKFTAQTARREEKLRKLFSRVEPLPPLMISRFGQIIKRFLIYKCYGLREQKPQAQK